MGECMLPSALKVDQWNLSLRSNASIPNGVKNSFALILLKKVVNYSYSKTGHKNYLKIKVVKWSISTNNQLQSIFCKCH